MLESKKSDGTVVVDISSPEIEKFDHLPTPEADGVSALSIMEGCSNTAFCVVPYTEVKKWIVPWLMLSSIDRHNRVSEKWIFLDKVNAYRGETPMARFVILPN